MPRPPFSLTLSACDHPLVFTLSVITSKIPGTVPYPLCGPYMPMTIFRKVLNTRAYDLFGIKITTRVTLMAVTETRAYRNSPGPISSSLSNSQIALDPSPNSQLPHSMHRRRYDIMYSIQAIYHPYSYTSSKNAPTEHYSSPLNRHSLVRLSLRTTHDTP